MYRRRAARPATQQRADARRELVEIERLDQVIVGAGVEAGDAVGDGVARGHDQHRPRVAARRIARQHVETALSRQAEIEQQQVVHALSQRELAPRGRRDPVDGEAVLRQPAPHAGADHRIVFGEQYAHHRAGAAGARFALMSWART